MSKINRKDKWRNVSLNEDNIDEYMSDLIADTKGRYITQGVSFNKEDSFQMGLLRQVILDHSSFSGLVKHLLTLYLSGQSIQPLNTQPMIMGQQTPSKEFYKPPTQTSQTETVTEKIRPSTIRPSTIRPLTTEKRKADDKNNNGQPRKDYANSASMGARKPSRTGSFLRPNPNAKPPKN